MTVRRATPDDLAWVSKLMFDFLNETGILNYKPKMVLSMVIKHINDSDKATFVVEKSGQIVGFMSAFLDQNIVTGELYARDRVCFVTPSYRNVELTRSIYKAFKTWAKESGCTEVLLSILLSKDNHSLKRVMEWFGCRTAGYILFDKL